MKVSYKRCDSCGQMEESNVESDVGYKYDVQVSGEGEWDVCKTCKEQILSMFRKEMKQR